MFPYRGRLKHNVLEKARFHLAVGIIIFLKIYKLFVDLGISVFSIIPIYNPPSAL